MAVPCTGKGKGKDKDKCKRQGARGARGKENIHPGGVDNGSVEEVCEE
jgi:hypothetical protein